MTPNFRVSKACDLSPNVVSTGKLSPLVIQNIHTRSPNEYVKYNNAFFLSLSRFSAKNPHSGGMRAFDCKH